MNTLTDYPLLGKLLYERYQVLQVLKTGAFAQTYIAEDILKPEYPYCVVKHFKLFSKEPNSLQTVRRRLAWEAVALKKLGNHQQIPQLLASFEDNQEFYLVQELIAGHPLSDELPISQHLGKLWTESQVIQLLQEVLGILEFVHCQGIIHCDIKPNNLVRRASDNRLFLIDFGSIRLIRPTTTPKTISIPVAMKLFGYLSAEQLTGQACPNTDIYALGMMGIQALTGLEPSQFPIDLDTGEVIWQHQVPISDELTFIFNNMVRYNFQDRYQSATEALQALQQLVLSQTPLVQTITMNKQSDSPVLTSSNTSQALKRVSVGVVAANTVAIMFASYTLMDASASENEADILVKAMAEYHEGDLENAIALAKSISAQSSIYPEAQVAILEWRQNSQTADAQFQVVEQAFNNGQWSKVLQEADKLPNTSFWKEKIKPIMQLAETNINAETYPFLQKAYNLASVKDFTGALKYLRQIPQPAQTDAKVQTKIAEYQAKQRIKADRLLQIAYNLASVNQFPSALKYLKQIPEETATYAIAQAKIVEYTKKQRFLAQAQKIPQSKTSANSYNRILQQTKTRKAALTTGNVSAVSNSSDVTIALTAKSEFLNLGNVLREVPPISLEIVSATSFKQIA